MATRKPMHRGKKKRSLLAELEEGFRALRDHREGRITLREFPAPLVLPPIDGDFIVKAREARGMSRPVFANRLGISPRSLERWEQGLSAPPSSVATLILLVAKYPDTLDRLASLAA